MAMATALMPSPDLKSTFTPFSESPASPIPYSVAFKTLAMQRQGGISESLAPPSPYPATVDPSPVESTKSTSTDATDIEEDASQESNDEDPRSPDIELLSPSSPAAQPPSVRIDTDSAARNRPTADDGPQSVIHAPRGFKAFEAELHTHQENPNSPYDQIAGETKRNSPSLASARTSTSPSLSENTVTSTVNETSKDTAPIDTNVPPTRHGAGSTPRASTAEEAEAEWQRKRARHSRNLSDTSEVDPSEENSPAAVEGVQSIGTALRGLNSQEQEIASLRATLSECWKLCTSLATLSASHRERMFSYSSIGDIQELAWGSCWRLCQKLYETRDEDHASQVRPTLELCRDFCQALFEARIRGDEVTDSILRVSFELNNHLYNTHDRNLPDIFSERTLEFYLTMCHRLMKQRTALPQETDNLLRAGWSLAELLINIRESKKDPEANDSELLSQAVQACWDLCDLFREGWSQARPGHDRATPRPHQRSFPAGLHSTTSSSGYAASRSGTSRPQSSLSLIEQNLPSVQERRMQNQIVPETPTTIFDDREDSASPSEPNMPNILVLGPENPASRNSGRWPSSASQSGYSEVSRTTGSSRTAQGHKSRIESSQSSPKSNVSGTDSATRDELDLVRIKALILKAAQNKGYPKNSSDAPTLPFYVQNLPTSAFGILPWQLTLFESYRKLVLSDPTLRELSALPIGRRLSAHEIAKAVIRIRQNESYAWISNLYTWVFGFEPEDATSDRGALQV